MTILITNGPHTATITRNANGYAVSVPNAPAWRCDTPGAALATARIMVGICPACLRSGHTSQACPELRAGLFGD